MPDRKRSLLWHGALLFLLGLVTGLVQQQFTNPRMGLAAHPEGLMNGTFPWNELRLTPRLFAGAYRTALYGTYANWVVLLLVGYRRG